MEGMNLPNPFAYRFVSEDIAKLALDELTQAVAGNMHWPDGEAFYPGIVIGTGEPIRLHVMIPLDTPSLQSLPAAQTLAAMLIRNAGIQLPEKAVGDAISQLEIQGVLYALTHLLPAGWLPIVQSILKAAGIAAPDSLTGIVTGAIAEEVKGMTRKKIVDALIDSLTELKASYDAAESDNILTQDEMKALGIKLVGLLVPKLFA